MGASRRHLAYAQRHAHDILCAGVIAEQTARSTSISSIKHQQKPQFLWRDNIAPNAIRASPIMAVNKQTISA